MLRLKSTTELISAKQLEQASGLDVYCAQVNANERTNMEQIVTRSGLKLTVEQRPVDRRVEVLLKTDPEPGCVLHWGVREPPIGEWQLPPRSLWPEGTQAFGDRAAPTPYANQK